MKRFLLPVMMVIGLFSLFARPALVLEAEGEGPGYALMAGVVERVSEQSLLSRMDGEGVLYITISNLLETEPNALSSDVRFSYGERSLLLNLQSDGKNFRHTEKNLEQKLSSMLLYDGRTLFDTEEALAIDHTYRHGYASLSPLQKGEHYLGLDAQGERWATVVVRQAFDEEGPVSLLVGTSGKELLPGMRLEKQAGKSVSLAVSSLLITTPSPSLTFEGYYSQEVGLYPFVLVLGGGFDCIPSQSSITSLYGQAGFAVHLPLSMIFSLHSGFWRNSMLVMSSTLGLGYSLVDLDLLYGSNATLLYRYMLQGLGLDVGVGSKHWASEKLSYSSGLFIQLGLTYTW